MCLDVITSDELGPISSFLDRGTCKNTLLPQLNDALRTQKPLSRMTTYPLWIIGASIQSNNPTVELMLSKNFLPKSSWTILALHKIYPPHDAGGAATDGMILISKWPWYTGDKHEPRACEFVCPDAHAFI